MRAVSENVAKDGTRTWRVRYRKGTQETSETFRRRSDAEMFAGILGDGRDNRVTEALAWLASKETEGHVETFADWFATYLAQLSGITPRTRADYEAMHRRYLTELDYLPLSLVSRAHVAGIVNRLDREGKSPKTIKNVVRMLSSVMGLAVDDGHVTRNPVKRVRLPQQRVDEDDVQFLTHEEAGALIAATAEHYRPLVIFLIGTGLRWSEATALQTRHVDLKHGTVRVQRAWKRIPGGWEIGPPKSPKSNRTINAAVAALVAVNPLLGKPSDLVFTTPRGGVVRHSNFYNRVWIPAVDRAGLDPRPTPHTCRHTFASYLISEGISLEAVQDQLGHESIETTRKTYAKLLPAVGVAAGKAASLAMENVLRHEAEARVSILAIEAASEAD